MNIPQATADAIQDAVAEVQEGVDKLLCPFGTTSLEQVSSHQGCDGVDQNCDGIVDDCIEDQSPPEITLDLAPPITPFSSVEKSFAFLEGNIKVTDDCSTELTVPLIKLVFLNEKASKAHFNVSVTDL